MSLLGGVSVDQSNVYNVLKDNFRTYVYIIYYVYTCTCRATHSPNETCTCTCIYMYIHVHVHEFTKTILLRLSRCSNCTVSVSFWNLPKNFRVYTRIASQFEFKLHDMLMRDAEGRKKEASKAIQTTQSKAHVYTPVCA